ncbi:hypothetical protein Halru_0477 [Halovivax ruber XH-70]|uniref:GrpB family protein n=1 Tax=Halovivax ruber (strain DSM 18193 / JCM 13892 / XH-70) TaxID=797302 RepID=L0IAX8_HALRX|nr:GrpB family protein [Halovivax ruber]AGB15112.1 hypothetical protein Halru_0477 [Halovivax ruber XH-70]
MVGLERGTVELVTHRECWRGTFEAEANRLQDIAGDRLREIEHVGSTAVEGLPAKPIIDLLGLVDSLETARELVSVLEDHGYEHRPNDDVEDRVFLAKGPETERTHYLSLTTPGSATHREQVAFRDYLRATPSVASRYAELKRELAARYPDDRASYTRGKSDFVESIVDRALDEELED